TRVARVVRSIVGPPKRVSFTPKSQVHTFETHADRVFAMYDSGVDGQYMSEADRHVGLAHGSVSKGKHKTKLPFAKLSPQANEDDSFNKFPHLLLSLGKTANDEEGISIYAKMSSSTEIGTAYHWSDIKANGNYKPHSNACTKHSSRPTASMTCHCQNR
ncbi:LOW QUALITY PROTEIN: hypothetical protein ACHAWF_010249, partial [Thalassiosira exigua]